MLPASASAGGDHTATQQATPPSYSDGLSVSACGIDACASTACVHCCQSYAGNVWACACCGCAPATCAACAILLARNCCVLLSAMVHLVAGCWPAAMRACMSQALSGGAFLWYDGASCPATHKPVTPAPGPLAICQCSDTALNSTCFALDRGAVFAAWPLGSWWDCCTKRALAPWVALVDCSAGATFTANYIGNRIILAHWPQVMGALLFLAWRPAQSQHASCTAWGPL